MKNQFATYEIAKKLKDLGANFEDILAYYGGHGDEYFSFPKRTNEYKGNIDAPLWQQVIDWLREEYNTHIDVYPVQNWDDYYLYSLNTINKKLKIKKTYPEGMVGIKVGDYFKTREQAILKALELIEKYK